MLSLSAIAAAKRQRAKGASGGAVPALRRSVSLDPPAILTRPEKILDDENDDDPLPSPPPKVAPVEKRDDTKTVGQSEQPADAETVAFRLVCRTTAELDEWVTSIGTVYVAPGILPWYVVNAWVYRGVATRRDNGVYELHAPLISISRARPRDERERYAFERDPAWKDFDSRMGHLRLCGYDSRALSRMTDEELRVAPTERTLVAHPEIPYDPYMTVRHGLVDEDFMRVWRRVTTSPETIGEADVDELETLRRGEVLNSAGFWADVTGAIETFFDVVARFRASANSNNLAGDSVRFANHVCKEFILCCDMSSAEALSHIRASEKETRRTFTIVDGFNLHVGVRTAADFKRRKDERRLGNPWTRTSSTLSVPFDVVPVSSPDPSEADSFAGRFGKAEEHEDDDSRWGRPRKTGVSERGEVLVYMDANLLDLRTVCRDLILRFERGRHVAKIVVVGESRSVSVGTSPTSCSLMAAVGATRIPGVGYPAALPVVNASFPLSYDVVSGTSPGVTETVRGRKKVLCLPRYATQRETVDAVRKLFKSDTRIAYLGLRSDWWSRRRLKSVPVALASPPPPVLFNSFCEPIVSLETVSNLDAPCLLGASEPDAVFLRPDHRLDSVTQIPMLSVWDVLRLRERPEVIALCVGGTIPEPPADEIRALHQLAERFLVIVGIPQAKVSCEILV